jgi:mannose-6-phosphate isomerase-like protein (cupin superfamily)
MFKSTLGRIAVGLSCFGLGALAVTALSGGAESDRPNRPLTSQIVRQDETRVTKGDWGRMYHYFTGETLATRNVLIAIAVVEPGKAVHRAHRHSMEEYLILTEGEGVWSLAGKETPAKAGDVLYVEPWVYHGLTNTGTEPLTFIVVRYDGKGIDPPPRPDDRPDEL